MANKKIEGLAKKIAYLNDECEKAIIYQKI